MATNSFNSDAKRNEIANGRRTMTARIPSENSRSPPSKRSDGIRRRHPTPTIRRRSVRRGISSKAVTSRLRRNIRFSNGPTCQSCDKSLEMKSAVLNEQIQQLHEHIAKVDKMMEKVVAKLTPEDMKRLMESSSNEEQNNDDVGAEEDSIEVITTRGLVAHGGSVDDEGIFHTMEPHETFERLYEDYSSKLDTLPDKISVLRDGKMFPPLENPHSLGVEDGELLTVKGVDHIFNTNKNMKQFTITQTIGNDPIELTLTKPPTYKVEDVYIKWAEYAGYEYNIFYLLYDQTKLPRTGTLEDYEVKNGSIIFYAMYRSKLIWGYMDRNESF